MTGIIYRAYCESENKSYIGQTTKELHKREGVSEYVTRNRIREIN